MKHNEEYADDADVAAVQCAVDAALSVVDVRTEEVLRLLGTNGNEPYLVGSLAAGLGDRWSDIDIHVLCSDDSTAPGPALAFTDSGACVDIRHVSAPRIRRLLCGDGEANGQPPKAEDAKLLSRWLCAMPLRPGAPDLLTSEQRHRAVQRLVYALTADVVVLAGFAVLAEHAEVERSWYLCRRAGVAVWELAAVLAGQHHLGERWLPARSTDPRVAAVGRLARGAEGTRQLDSAMQLIGVSLRDIPRRIALSENPQAEKWAFGPTQQWLLVGGRRLVEHTGPAPKTLAATLEDDPGAAFHALAAAAWTWSVDVSDIRPRLGSVG